MKRALFVMILSPLVVSLVTAQKRAKVAPKQYRLTEIEYSGSVSRDGRFLAYADALDGEDHVFVRDLKTGEKRRLTQPGTGWEASMVTISPDGTQVAYCWTKIEEIGEDRLWELRAIGFDGSGDRVLYGAQDLRWLDPLHWSPTGKHILAHSWRKDGTYQIVFISVADGSVRVLKTFDRRPPFALGESGMRVSPNGRYIAYDFPAKEGSPQRDIFILPTDGGPELPVVEHPANDLLLDWTPDGKQILFASDRRGALDAWLIDVADGKPRGSPVLVKTNLGSLAEPVGFTGDGS